jgi:plastocyanin
MTPTSLVLALTVFAAPPDKSKVEWAGSDLPLQMVVKTPEDLAFKAAAERQYLLLNLLLGGRQAYDKQDWAKAVEQWESLLSYGTDLSPSVAAVVKAGVAAARAKSPGLESRAPALETPSAAVPPPSEEESKRMLVQVAGTVTGGGNVGPGGSVVLLRRADGSTPKPKANRAPLVVQKDKRFSPHVIVVPVGAAVQFRNEDEIAHNVFSLSQGNAFDLGLYKSGTPKDHVFKTPGPVHLLCNIHAAMQGWVYVADTPWYTQADASGRFVVKNVPPGLYDLEVWHEQSTKGFRRQLRVSDKMEAVLAQVDGDKRPAPFVPDKSGQPRQEHLGY